ncbi:putative unusual protein kinase [Xenococcus sp. PCC 7305]|uniref:ABC1 kinase family protein n=1 Tax=Xenococcus sp. PCC 7305 TaxID=102125 RepID=UPI0002ACBA15|nr:AarF/ABC1/UbiB kinase family protein [Xenococcus sp. PCC 7305]ELS01436.1 putative unusual protein kinase [Xenococcus sp. PCC 7305]
MRKKRLLSWSNNNYSPFFRQVKTFFIASQFFLSLWWDNLVGNNSSQQKTRRAKWLVGNLLNLGPTFIKIGQALSTRADLIPLEYVQEFSQLQDRVPPFASEKAIAAIEKELGKPIYSTFRDFDPKPIAAASLGQVHKARLHTGEDIVVKVQRPGLEKLFNLDFEILHRLVRLINRFSRNLRKYNLEAIYQEFFELLFQEIDYIHEGKNAERFRENFQKYHKVIAPKVYWKYTTRKILSLEYLPGIKIDDLSTLEANKVNPKEVIQLGITCYLKQLLEDGFFQSDPHPGNMAVTPQGEIIFYDFGTMAEVKAIAQDQMVKTFFAVLKNDADEVVQTLIYMGLIEPVSDMTPIKRMVSFLLSEFRDKPIDVRAFEQLTDEIYLMFEQQPFRLPPQMTFIIKSLTTLDGIARVLDPQYNLLAAAQPFFKNMAFSQKPTNILGAVARQAKDLVQYKFNQPNPTELSIQRLESRLELGELQVRVRSVESDRSLKLIQLGIKSLIFTCLTGFTLLSGTMFFVNSYRVLSFVMFGLSGLWFLLLMRSLMSLVVKEKMARMGK